MAGFTVYYDHDGFRIYVGPGKYLDRSGRVCDVGRLGEPIPTAESKDEVEDAISLYLLNPNNGDRDV